MFPICPDCGREMKWAPGFYRLAYCSKDLQYKAYKGISESTMTKDIIGPNDISRSRTNLLDKGDMRK